MPLRCKSDAITVNSVVILFWWNKGPYNSSAMIPCWILFKNLILQFYCWWRYDANYDQAKPSQVCLELTWDYKWRKTCFIIKLSGDQLKYNCWNLAVGFIYINYKHYFLEMFMRIMMMNKQTKIFSKSASWFMMVWLGMMLSSWISIFPRKFQFHTQPKTLRRTWTSSGKAGIEESFIMK